MSSFRSFPAPGRGIAPARVLLALHATAVFSACDAAPPQTRVPPGEPGSPYAAASGVTHADSSPDGHRFRVVPLRTMTGDAEILYGDPEQAGVPFVMRIRELPGTRIPLHSHPVDEHVTVVSGTWYFALGETWDSTALQELKTGTYAFAPRGSMMYGYSPDGAVVQVHGIGPFHIAWRDGSATLDDPDAAKTFTFRRGERVRAVRDSGVIRHGYASGAIVQYEIEGDRVGLFMADQQELRRIP